MIHRHVEDGDRMSTAILNQDSRPPELALLVEEGGRADAKARSITQDCLHGDNRR
jgi:hypothetical protein